MPSLRVHVQDWLLEPISLIPCSLRLSFARKMTETRFSPYFTGELRDSNMESSPLIGSGASKCLERISCSRCVVQSHQTSRQGSVDLAGLGMGIIGHHLQDDDSCVHQSDTCMSQTGDRRDGRLRLKPARGIDDDIGVV